MSRRNEAQVRVGIRYHAGQASSEWAASRGFMPLHDKPRKEGGRNVARVVLAWCGDSDACFDFQRWALDSLRDRVGHHGERVESLSDLLGAHALHGDEDGEVYAFEEEALFFVCSRHGDRSWWRGVARDEWFEAAREVFQAAG